MEIPQDFDGKIFACGDQLSAARFNFFFNNIYSLIVNISINYAVHRLRTCQDNQLAYWEPNLVRDMQCFLDMFGDFHTQFAYAKTIFRTYWTPDSYPGLSAICRRLRRTSIKKESKIFFESEELLLHVFQGFILSSAVKAMAKIYPTIFTEMSSKWPLQRDPTPDDVFRIARLILNDMKILDTVKSLKNVPISDPIIITKKMIFDITIFFYFKNGIRKADGFKVVRSLKFLFIRFLGTSACFRV